MSVVIAASAIAGLALFYSGLVRGPSTGRGVVLRAIDGVARDSGAPNLTGRRLVLLTAGFGLVSFVVVSGLTSSVVVAGALSAAAASAPLSWARGRAQRRRRRHREAWPDALATLIAGVRAGVSLPEATATLAERAPVELRHGFRAFNAAYRASGSLAAGLARLRDVLMDPVADRVVAALLVAHQVGGSDLVRVLRTTGDFVREDVRVRKEIEARWSWTVVAARLAAAAPWVVLLLMSIRPEAARAYSSAAGAAVIGAGAAVTIVGYRLMLRAARLPEDRRLP